VDIGITGVFCGGAHGAEPLLSSDPPPLLSASISGRLRHRPFWIVVGLAASFTLFGVTFAAFGSFLGLSNAALRRAALIVLFFFSLSLLWPRLWEGAGVRIGALARKLPGAESATLQAPGGGIRFRFDAPKLNLVMKGIGKGTAGKVLIDGVPIAPNLRGDDVRSDGKVEVTGS
jgi:hypothetical protein